MIPQIPDQIERLVQIQQNEPKELSSVDEEVRSFALQWLNEHCHSLEDSPINDQLQSLKKALEDKPLHTLPSFLEDWIKNVDRPSEQVLSFFKECTLSDYMHCMSNLLDRVPLERLWPIFNKTFKRTDIAERVLQLLLDKISAEKVLAFLAKPDSVGYNLLFFSEVIKALFNACPDKVPAEKILELLATKVIEDNTPLHEPGAVQALFGACPEKINANQVLRLLQLRGQYNRTPLHNSEAVQALLDVCPEKIGANVVTYILQARDKYNSTPLHNSEAVQALLDACPEKINTNQVLRLLQLRDRFNRTPLQSYKNVQAALRGIFDAHDKQLEFNVLSQILRVQNQQGEFILFNDRTNKQKNLQLLLQFIPKRISIDQLFELLKAQDSQGKTILHQQVDLPDILPLIKQYPKEEWTKIFSLQDRRGNTALHLCSSLQTIKEISSHLDPSVMEIPNDLGEILLDKLFTTSKSWLHASKTTVVQEDLSETEFRTRANALKETVFSLWDGLVFGEEQGQVPSTFLFSNSRTFTQNQVHEALTTMLERISQKKAWAGTPREEQVEELHKFYTPMLLNFEKLAKKLQEKNDLKEITGVLFDIAKTQLEERCAAAYQGEIEQACQLILGEEADLSTEALLQTGAKNALIKAIEEIMYNSRTTNVHTYNQLAYAAGILPARDPLSQVSVNECRRVLKKKWANLYVLPALIESFRKIPQEQLFDWLKEKTKEAFGESYLTLKTETESQEEQIRSSVKEALLEQGIPDEEAEKALELFRSSKGSSLVLGKTLIDTDQEIKETLTNLISNFSKRDLDSVVEEGLSHLEEEGWQGVFDSIRKTLAIPLQERLSWQTMSQTFIRSLENVQKIKQEPFMQNLTDEQKRSILTAKQDFDSQMKTLVDQMTEKEYVDLFINLKEHGLPSTGVESSRKAAFAASFFSKEEKGLELKRPGVYFIGKEIGLLEEVS